MTIRGDARKAAADPAAAARDAADPVRARLFVYSIGLIIAFCIYLVVHGWGQNALFWALAAVALAGLASGVLFAEAARRGWFFHAAVILAVTIAVVVPVGPLTLRLGSLSSAIAGTTVWPQILVALFGSRVLAELAELQFSELWRHPFSARRAAPVQSIAAALALGACLTLLFYLIGSHIGRREGASSGIVVSALFGGSITHHVIVFLFFVILALLVDATLIYVGDRSAVAAIRARVRADGGIGRAELQRMLDTELAPWSHTRAVRLIREALDAGAVAPAAAPSPLEGFHLATRRFIRGLIPLLPLLGFLGTVIGLTIALSELPSGLSSGQRETFDIGGSLAGLAVQFETTLLGLLGSMIASLALGVLEKSETELAAECALLVEAADARDRRGVA